MTPIQEYILATVNSSMCTVPVLKYWLQRTHEGNLTRDEGSKSHLGCYFLPYNSKTKKVFIVHHKKSGLWLFPGGHVDKDELPMQTLNREIGEELGVWNRIEKSMPPFLLSITPILHSNHECIEHLDFWFRFDTDGSEFNIDRAEFHSTRWEGFEEARKLLIDQANIDALNRTESFLNSL